MQTPRTTHARIISLCHCALLLGAIASSCIGCALKLPAPKTYHTQISDQLLLKRLCPSGAGTVAFLLEEDAHLSGAISCEDARTTIVLLNNFGIRVRTITIAANGEAQDEVSYLSSNHTPIEELLSLLATARESADRTAKSSALTARISLAEPLPTQR